MVKPKAPLLDWINALYPEIPEDGGESTVYLIKEKFDGDEVTEWLEKNFKKIFDNELNERHTDKKDWPKKRTYQLFLEWFDTEVNGIVIDIETSRLEKY